MTAHTVYMPAIGAMGAGSSVSATSTTMPVSPDFNRDVWAMLGIPFDIVNMEEGERKIREAAMSRRPCFLITPNTNFVASAEANARFRDVLMCADLSTVDGWPLVRIARLLGIPLAERVSGADLFEAMRRPRRATRPLSVYLFGGPDGVADAARHKLNADASSSLHCVGARSPGFGSTQDMSAPEILGEINDSGADFLVVALGAVKGHDWIVRNRRALNVPVVSHLGAVINFVAGSVKRSPVWMQSLGLEWVWRILQEPALWRRYFSDARVLGRLLLLRVLPYWLWLRRTAGQFEHAQPGTAAVESQADGRVLVRLSGAFQASGLQSLRTALAQAAESPRRIELDFSAATYVDSAALGLFMVLYGHVKAHDGELRMSNVPAAVRPVFRYTMTEFLLGDAPGASC